MAKLRHGVKEGIVMLTFFGWEKIHSLYMEMELLSLYFTKKVCNYIDNTMTNVSKNKSRILKYVKRLQLI